MEAVRLDYSYDDMVRMAELSELLLLINPDDPRFANPENMLREITAYCEETGQAVPRFGRRLCTLYIL